MLTAKQLRLKIFTANTSTSPNLNAINLTFSARKHSKMSECGSPNTCTYLTHLHLRMWPANTFSSLMCAETFTSPKAALQNVWTLSH